METKRNKAWRRFQENRVFKARMLKFAGWQIVVWDENGNCIEFKNEDYGLDGIVVESRYVSVYDENNKETERIKYEGLAEETEKEVYFYYDDGKMKETQIVDIETGKINSRDLYLYALDGKLSEIVTYEGSEITEKWVYSYNQHGDILLSIV